MSGFSYFCFATINDLFCMTHKSFDSALTVISYLNATGDTLSSNVCKALGLPSSKCYIFYLRKRIADILSLTCPQDENRNTNDKIVLENVPCLTAIESQIEALQSDIFTTADITSKLSVPRRTLSRAISNLLIKGKIELVEPNRRPKLYRRIPTVKKDYLETYIRVHNLTDDEDYAHQIMQLFPIYVNRAYCGLSKPVISISDDVLQFALRSCALFPNPSDILPEQRANIDNLVLLIFNSGRDFRVVRRKLTEGNHFSERTRKVLLKLTNEQRRTRLMNKYCLPNSITHVLSTEYGMRVFYESALHTLGGDIARKPVYQIIPTITARLQHDIESKMKEIQSDSSLKTNHSYSMIVEQIVDSSIMNVVSQLDIPEKRVNVKKMYTQFAQDIQ